MTSCTEQEQEDYFNQYGKDKAYIKSDIGCMVHLEGDVCFYSKVELSDIQKKAFKAACKNASKASGITIQYGGKNETKYNSSPFKVNVDKVKEGNKDSICSTDPNYDIYGKITDITITIHKLNFPRDDYDFCLSVLTHELGHCLGLLDYYTPKEPKPSNQYTVATKDIADYSIMHGYLGVHFADYQKFDKANIDYYYYYH